METAGLAERWLEANSHCLTLAIICLVLSLACVRLFMLLLAESRNRLSDMVKVLEAHHAAANANEKLTAAINAFLQRPSGTPPI